MDALLRCQRSRRGGDLQDGSSPCAGALLPQSLTRRRRRHRGIRGRGAAPRDAWGVGHCHVFVREHQELGESLQLAAFTHVA